MRLRSFLLGLLSLLLAAPVPGATKKPSTSKPSAPSAPKKPAPVEAYPAETESGAPQIRAAASIVVDAQTGRVLHEQNADLPRQVASTQKLLTALIVAEAGSLDAPVRVEAPDTWAEPTMLYIKPGDVYRRGDLLRILLVKSMNDVARCLARDNAGSLEAFAARMNARAAQLGMNSSHFVNPNGLPAPDQHSTARDMSRLALAAYRNRTLRSIVSLKQTTWRYPDGHLNTFTNTNQVLKDFALCNGMKTGYTEAAGHCLVASASADGRDVISVVLGDTKSIWLDSHRLLSWGLSGGVAAK